MNKVKLRSLQAALFSFGGPLGWLTIKYFQGVPIAEELQTNWGLYAYMLFGTLTVFIGFGSYVGRKEQYITELATRDALTGIFNLRYFNERLTQEISIARRHHTPLSLIYFDLDFFKKVNDQHIVLQKVTHKVKEMVRAHDIFARVGGEEFAILLPRCSQIDAISNAERIRKAVEDLEIEFNTDQSLNVTISAGVVSWHRDEPGREFYKRADEELYLAKQQGRNRVVSKMRMADNLKT
jgi:diguanylate cyclase (GGDEF)-like protein